MPEKARWPYADLYMGDGWSVAYRTLDAQYWGVPQRRRRIYLVADLAGGGAGKILFESEGLSGYSAEGFRSWQRAAGSAEKGAYPTVAGALTARYDSSPCVDRGPTVVVTALENHPLDSRVKLAEDGNVQTLTSRMGTGGNNVPLVMKIRSGSEGGGKGALIQENKSATLSCNNDQTLFEPCGLDGGQISPTLTKQNAGGNQRMPDKDNFTCVLQPFGISSKDSNAMKSDNPHSGIYEAETARTLDTGGGNPSCNQGGIAVIESYAIQGSMIGRDDKNGPRGDGINEDVSFTLNTVDRHAVYAMTTGSFTQVDEDTSPTIMARDYKDPNAICMGHGYTVRRLTPAECARLQGFPDNWCADLGTEKPTDEEMYFWHKVFKTYSEVTGCKMKSDKQVAKWLKDPYSDSAEYKMWGNGVALPCVWFVLCGIVWYAQSESK